MNKPTKFAGSTIRLSDTVDQYARRVHINVRNGKATLVYRWKDHHSPKAHTQRMTLDEAQAGRLVAAISMAAVVAYGENTLREQLFTDSVRATTVELAKRCEEASK